MGRAIAADDRVSLERLARYVRRLHLTDSRIVYDEAHDRVIYGSGKAPHPGFRANFRIFDAQNFVAEVTGFLPDTYQHESVAYGEYSNAVRGKRAKAPFPGKGAAFCRPPSCPFDPTSDNE